MQAGYVISGIAHAGFIGWALFGGMFTPKDQESVFNNVSVLSEAEFQAMIASDQVPEVSQFDLTALEPSEDTDVVPTLAEQTDQEVDQSEPEQPEPVAEEITPPEPVEPLVVPTPDITTPDVQPPAPQIETAMMLPDVSTDSVPIQANRVAPTPVAPPEQPAIVDADVVQALNVMSLLNPNITHTMIDGDVYQDEVKNKKIMSVPTIFLNNEEFYQGRMELEEIVAKIDSRSDSIESEKLNKKEDFDVLIVGGGPAGASSAVYSARKGIKTGIVAERFGGQVMDTLGIENFISVKATEGPKLVKALEEHVLDYEVDVMNHQRAKKIHIPKNKEEKFQLELDNGAKLKSKTLILSTGARWRELGVLGEADFTGKGVAYCPHCEGPLFKGKHVEVIGGGT